MHLLLYALVSLATAAVGLACGVAVGALCVSWYRITSFEGYSGYFVAYVALAGAFAGGLTGLMTAVACEPRGGADTLRTLAYGALWVAALAVVVGVVCRLLAAGTPQPDADELAAEMRPPPSAAELAALRAAEDRARFDAVPADAPISAWLEVIQAVADDEIAAAAVERIRARPAYVAELAALMDDDDAKLAAAALLLVRRITEPPAELAAAVGDAGRALVARLRATIDTPASADGAYLWAAAISRRFSAWLDAVRSLRESGAAESDEELARILELARRRPDSTAMRMDVVRVASYWLHQWTGVEPLPSDPPPR